MVELEGLLTEATRLPPLLQRCLARAQRRPLDDNSAEAELVCGWPVAAAPLLRNRDRADGQAGYWLCADPVDLLPDLNAVWVRPGARLAADSELLADLEALFAAEGMRFELADPSRAFISLPAPPAVLFQPPWRLPGRSLDDVLPAGPDAPLWRRLLTETQVLLHQAARRGGGGPGSLWFWGGGELPARDRGSPRVARVCSDDPVMLALADWLGLPRAELAGIDQASDGTLVDWPVDPRLSADENLNRLAAELRPLWLRLRGFRINALELAGRELCWRLSAAGSWQLWRQRWAPPEPRT